MEGRERKKLRSWKRGWNIYQFRWTGGNLMKRYGRHVSRIRNLKHPLTVYPAMGWPPSRVRGQTRRQRACNGVFKRSRSLKSRFFLWNLCLFSQRKILPSFFLRYAFLIRSKFFLFCIWRLSLTGACCSFCFRKNSSTLERFHLQISRIELYPERSKYVDQLLHEIATRPIVHVGEWALLTFSRGRWMSRISSGNGRSLVSLGERRERERGEGGREQKRTILIEILWTYRHPRISSISGQCYTIEHAVI